MKAGGRLQAAVLTSAILVGAGLVAFATPATADQGLAEKGHSRYVVSDNGAPVRVTTTVTVTNQVPDSGGMYSFWDGYPLWLPNGAAGLKAVSQGGTLSTHLDTRGRFTFAVIDFPSRLLYGQSRTITVTYTVKGAPPRSTAPGRVGPGFVAIDAYSPGDTGQARIDIESPRWLTLDAGDPYTEATTGDTRVATLTGGGPAGLSTSLSLRDISQSTAVKVPVDGAMFTVQAFPGDLAWRAFVAARLPATVRTLEKLTGRTWPKATTIITEDYSAQVYGWDGLFTATGITVSEELDHDLLAHELAHAWADEDHLDKRWLIEGLAQELAHEATTALKVKAATHPSVRRTQKGSFPLNDWAWESARASGAEDYGYPASWQTMHALMSGSAAAKRPDVVRMLVSSQSVYDTPGDRSVAVHPTSWKQAYDAFELEGGNRSTQAVMSQWVLTKADVALIAQRATTRAAYAARDKADGAWAPPRGVRAAMYDWSFPDARRELARTSELATHAVAAQQAASASGLSAATLRHAYEAASGSSEYAAADGQLTAFTRQADRYRQLRTETTSANPLARLGQLVLRPAELLADARAAVVRGDTKAADRALASAASRSSWATRVGAVIVLALLLLAVGVVLLARRGRRRPAAQVPAPAPATFGDSAPAADPVTAAEEPPADESDTAMSPVG